VKAVGIGGNLSLLVIAADDSPWSAAILLHIAMTTNNGF